MPAKIRCDDPEYTLTISHMGLMRHLLPCLNFEKEVC